MLEVAWEALEDAGQVPEHLADTNTGVFIGVWQKDYSHIQMEVSERNFLNAYSAIGSLLNMVPNRISYWFDFLGPSLPVDTACSSSLIAVHLAFPVSEMASVTAASLGDRHNLLIIYIEDHLGKILGRIPAQIDVHKPLNSMEIDSLMTIKLRHRLVSNLSNLAVDVPVEKFIASPSITELSELFLEQMTLQKLLEPLFTIFNNEDIEEITI